MNTEEFKESGEGEGARFYMHTHTHTHAHTHNHSIDSGWSNTLLTVEILKSFVERGGRFLGVFMC